MTTTAASPPVLGTRERILKVAERLFADRGFDAVSLRMITTEAGVNLAAVNYHFGSKEALIEGVISHHIGPINAQRVSRLKAASKRGALTVETIVDCFIAPVVEEVTRSSQSDSVLCGLIGRIMGEQNGRIREIVAAQFPEVVRLFSDELAKALPEIPREVMTMRILFMAGSLVQSLLCFDQMGRVSGTQVADIDLETVHRQILPFLVAGVSAPLKNVTLSASS